MPGLFQALRNTAVDLLVMDVKHNESAQRGLVPVLSSCTRGFPVEALQALMLGRHGGGLWELWKTGQEDRSVPSGLRGHLYFSRKECVPISENAAIFTSLILHSIWASMSFLG